MVSLAQAILLPPLDPERKKGETRHLHQSGFSSDLYCLAMILWGLIDT